MNGPPAGARAVWTSVANLGLPKRLHRLPEGLDNLVRDLGPWSRAHRETLGLQQRFEIGLHLARQVRSHHSFELCDESGEAIRFLTAVLSPQQFDRHLEVSQLVRRA